MPLLGINPGRPRDELDPIQKVAIGVDIAKSVLGLGLAIPEYLQKKRIGEAELTKLRSENAPLTEAERQQFTAQGVPGLALPRTRGEARDLAGKLFETPQQKASRERQDKLLEIAVTGSRRAETKEKTLDQQSSDKLNDMDVGIDKINEAVSLKLSKGIETGPVVGTTMRPEFTKSQDRVAMEQNINTAFDAYRKAVTGTGAAARELTLLQTRFPQSTDTNENFLAKAQGTIKGMRRIRALYLDNERKRGKDVSQFLGPEDERLIAESKARARVVEKVLESQEWLQKNPQNVDAEMVRAKMNSLIDGMGY